MDNGLDLHVPTDVSRGQSGDPIHMAEINRGVKL